MSCWKNNDNNNNNNNNQISLTVQCYIDRLYKNKVTERTGWNEDVLRWCLDAAKDSGTKKEDFMGGFVIDEMKIQVNFTYPNVKKKAFS